MTIPEAGGLRVFNYTTQPEDAGVGVIAHEYGHDLGLPDLYDSVGPTTDSDVGFWDIMAVGSNSGKLIQTQPTHMGAWSKYVLGWLEPEVLEYGSKRAEFVLGQAAKPPKGTDDRGTRQTCRPSGSRSVRRTPASSPGGARTTRAGPTSG